MTTDHEAVIELPGAFNPAESEKWIFARMGSAEEFADLTGRPLAEHEGYYRANNGNWIVVCRDPDGESGGPVCEVTFRGTAKRGQAYGAPDPVGMARARLIAAAPDLYKALAIALGVIEKAGIIWMGEDSARAALAKAQGA